MCHLSPWNGKSENCCLRLTLELMLGTLVVGPAPISATGGRDSEDGIPRLSIAASHPQLADKFLTGP
jgi:hypothetical protein